VAVGAIVGATSIASALIAVLGSRSLGRHEATAQHQAWARQQRHEAAAALMEHAHGMSPRVQLIRSQFIDGDALSVEEAQQAYLDTVEPLGLAFARLCVLGPPDLIDAARALRDSASAVGTAQLRKGREEQAEAGKVNDKALNDFAVAARSVLAPP
jgi:hypothetical protein